VLFCVTGNPLCVKLGFEEVVGGHDLRVAAHFVNQRISPGPLSDVAVVGEPHRDVVLVVVDGVGPEAALRHRQPLVGPLGAGQDDEWHLLIDHVGGQDKAPVLQQRGQHADDGDENDPKAQLLHRGGLYPVSTEAQGLDQKLLSQKFFFLRLFCILVRLFFIPAMIGTQKNDEEYLAKWG